jgi:thiamine-monophosphate kinase
MSEFDLIGRLRQLICLPENEFAPDCSVGIGDDAAVLHIPSGHELVVSTDTLVEGIHFPRVTHPEAIGHKALAVNLSDLAAMGAQPTFFFMALTLPAEDSAWLDAFAQGMARLASRFRVQLAGGDTTRGPLSITITALGTVEKGQALLRSGAQAGDLVIVSGAPGAAAQALSVTQEGREPEPSGRMALEFPEPRISLGKALAKRATSCIDLSDGLAADLGHILQQSGVGAELELDRLPVPPGLDNLADEPRWRLQLAGGDDYELCFTIPPGRAGELDELSESCGVALTPIGTIVTRTGLELITKDGGRFELASAGFRHFSDGEESLDQAD